MQWNSEGIILAVRKFKERAAIITLLTEKKGVYSGLVRQARTPAMRTILQIGNRVDATWSARLEEHLGDYRLELLSATASKYLHHRLRLNALSSLMTLIHQTIPDAEGADLFPKLSDWLSMEGTDEELMKAYLYLEMDLLMELGYGLDMSCCAATGSTDELIYLSPKSGRAVSKEAGKPYDAKLFKPPRCLMDKEVDASVDDIHQGLQILEHFLHRFFYEPHQLQMPIARGGLMDYIGQRIRKRDPVDRGLL